VLGEIEAALAGTSGRAAVVIFSDGRPNQPDIALGAARQLVEGRRDGICFHGVQTGDDPEGTRFLTELSRVSNCGSVSRAAQVGSPAGLDQLARSVFAGPGLPPVSAPPPCESVVRLHGIEFEFDRADITEDSGVVLDAALDQLRECGTLRVSIGGHTDSIGTDDYNAGLSQRRADAVRDYILDKGVDEGRLSTRGFGESNPIAPNDTADGRARNRRVELVPLE
jgi:OOP family OmpA-OmpF porin